MIHRVRLRAVVAITIFRSLAHAHRAGVVCAITAPFAVPAIGMALAIAVAMTVAPAETVTDGVGGVELGWLRGRRVGGVLLLETVGHEDAIVDRSCEDRHVGFGLGCFVGMLLTLTADTEEEDGGEEESADHGPDDDAGNGSAAEGR